MKLLNSIQQGLKVPKNQNNSFGNYKYRSCEDILEAVKPLLKDKGILTINDEIVLIGNRYYVKATAMLREFLINGNLNDTIVSAYAREEENKKGMDCSQITGSASSYARKYALNGLFCIDDTKDSDHTNKHEKPSYSPSKPSEPQQTSKPDSKPEQQAGKPTDNQKRAIHKMCGALAKGGVIDSEKKYLGGREASDLSFDEASKHIDGLMKLVKEMKESGV